MTATAIRRKVLGDLVDTRLRLLPDVVVFRGEIPDQPPVLMNGPTPDPSGRVDQHIVWFAGVGNPTVEQDVADANTELAWGFTTICVGGFHDDCLALVDATVAILFRWVPTLDDHAFGRIKPPPGFDPGSPRRIDRPGVPPRFELPLLWRLDVTTS